MLDYKHYNEFENNNLYKAGMYLRLSREDEDKLHETDTSQSINNQRDFITNYALENGFNIIETYCDDGISGTTFERDDFQRMIQDIENKKINMVITKDLSRLGRDYIQTGYYLEKYFPEKNVRFIAINDGYDSFNEGYANEMAPFRSVFNDMYAKDISKKVRTSLKTKQLKGEYIGTTAPFGYMKNPDKKGQLIPDPVSSKYVQKIFELYLSGNPLLRIANYLTANKVPTPSEYRNVKNTQKYIKGLWNEKTVKFILNNEVYIGHTIQNKKKKINYKIKKQIDIPKSQWIKVKNTHEPIISEHDFLLANSILSKRAIHKTSKVTHLLSGLIFCANCGAPITYVPQHTKGKYYTCCSTAKRTKKELNLCQAKLIPEDIVNNYVIGTLKNICIQYLDENNLATKLSNSKYSFLINDLQKEQRKLKDTLENNNTISFNLYKDKVNGIIDNTQFIELSKNLKNENESLLQSLEKIEEKTKNFKLQIENQESIKKTIHNFISLKDINRNLLALLIDKIVIDLDKTITIYFTFATPDISNIL